MVQKKDNLRSLMGVRRIDYLMHVYHEDMVVDGRIDEYFLWWFNHIGRMKNSRVPKGINEGD